MKEGKCRGGRRDKPTTPRPTKPPAPSKSIYDQVDELDKILEDTNKKLETDPRLMVFFYTNYKGVESVRRIQPGVLWWGKTKWHSQEQWFLSGFDIDKGAMRDFAFDDMRPLDKTIYKLGVALRSNMPDLQNDLIDMACLKTPITGRFSCKEMNHSQPPRPDKIKEKG